MDMPSASDASTLEFYQTNAPSYIGARPDEVSPDLLAFLPHVPAGARILELGCGGGSDALAMERLGYRVDATDGVAAMAAIANERLSHGARTMRFDQLNATAEYDAVVACASLLHVPAKELPVVLRRIHEALTAEGWHFASFKTGGSPGWDQHGRYYNYPDEDDMEAAYRSAGHWARLAFETYDGVGYFSEPARWLTVTAQKSG
ncbi:class I SAM-dependent methyltransferase [Sphingomonas sp. S1-29]|uniref:class I SAM-dependent methyltransferase n=1 Tax=Sphingomonas sp. S1-29 TaxID=2991074 RepID=UPI00223EE03F|nr:class I SAM-dependent methyltransferase [Sphingomonas sp. S1-29]UZK69686.1 class I SAM-dependent methyltransferase [Sphingomonas sp. S1-29]